MPSLAEATIPADSLLSTIVHKSGIPQKKSGPPVVEVSSPNPTSLFNSRSKFPELCNYKKGLRQRFRNPTRHFRQHGFCVREYHVPYYRDRSIILDEIWRFAFEFVNYGTGPCATCRDCLFFSSSSGSETCACGCDKSKHHQLHVLFVQVREAEQSLAGSRWGSEICVDS